MKLMIEALQGNSFAKHILRETTQYSDVSIRVANAFYSRSESGEAEVFKSVKHIEITDDYTRKERLKACHALTADGVEWCIRHEVKQKETYRQEYWYFEIVNKYK